MATFMQVICLLISQCVYHFQLVIAFDMIKEEELLKQHTFRYEARRYPIFTPPFLRNESLIITDIYNNSISYNSMVLSINDEYTFHYLDDYNFNEIQNIINVAPDGDDHDTSNPVRRRLRSYDDRHSRDGGDRDRHNDRHDQRPREDRDYSDTHHHRDHDHDRKRDDHHRNDDHREHSGHRRGRRRHRRGGAEDRWMNRWSRKTERDTEAKLERKSAMNKRRHKLRTKGRNRYATQGRFVGYYRAYKRGLTFHAGKRYCKRKYGGVASINTQHENNQAKRVCQVILGEKSKRGYYCWIGLYGKPFDKWTDNREVGYKAWSLNQRHVDRYGEYSGRDKCVGMYKDNGKWYHQRCSYRNGVICQKPHGIYVGNYIVIQKQYRFDKAQKVCKQWYGTNLASVYDDNQNREVRRACQQVSDTGHCWIGLQEPFRYWNDNQKVGYTNWAPGEPNHQDREKCVEIYPSARWNNVPCRVHRYPVCNSKPFEERMSKKKRDQITKSQYTRFRMDWLKNHHLRWMKKQKSTRSWQEKLRRDMMRRLGMRVYDSYRDNLRTMFFNSRFNLKGKNKLGYRPLINQQMLRMMYIQKYGVDPLAKRKQQMMMMRRRGNNQRLNKLALQRLWNALFRKITWDMMRKKKKSPHMGYEMSRNSHRPSIFDIGDLDGIVTEDPDLKMKRLDTHALDGMKDEIVWRQQRSANEMGSATPRALKKGKIKETVIPRPPKIQLVYPLRRLLQNEVTDEHLEDIKGNGIRNGIDINDRITARGLEKCAAKCVLVVNVEGLHELCIVNGQYVEIRTYIGRKGKTDDIDVDLEVMAVDTMIERNGFTEISNATDVEVDYVDYEQWKYKQRVLMEHDDDMNLYQSLRVGNRYTVLHNVEDETYYAVRYRLQHSDWTQIRRRVECWSLLNHIDEVVKLCISLNDEYIVHLSIMDWSRETFDELSLDWIVDSEWDEITIYFSGEREKCAHLREMKVCIKCDTECDDMSSSIQQIDVLIHQEMNANEAFG